MLLVAVVVVRGRVVWLGMAIVVDGLKVLELEFELEREWKWEWEVEEEEKESGATSASHAMRSSSTISDWPGRKLRV